MPIGDNGYIAQMLLSIYGPSKEDLSWLTMPRNLHYEGMKAFLKLGKVDVEVSGEKSWEKLHAQILGKDVKLVIPLDPAFPDIFTRIILVRRSAKATIYAENRKYRLREKRRIHENGTMFVNSECEEEPSNSETAKIGELAIDAMVRGLREELGLEILAEQLTPVILTEHHAPIRPSRVYRRILSLEIPEYFILELPERPWEEYSFLDDGVRIEMEWVLSNKK